MKKRADQTSLFITQCFWKSLREKGPSGKWRTVAWIEPVRVSVSLSFAPVFPWGGILTLQNVSNVSLSKPMGLVFLNSYFLTAF